MDNRERAATRALLDALKAERAVIHERRAARKAMDSLAVSEAEEKLPARMAATDEAAQVLQALLDTPEPYWECRCAPGWNRHPLTVLRCPSCAAIHYIGD